MDVSHCDDGHLAWLDFARGDGLQDKNRARCDHDGIDSGLRSGAVPAFAVDGDAWGIGIGVVNSWNDANLTRGQPIPNMHCHGAIGPGDRSNKPSLTMPRAPRMVSSAG